MTADTLPPYSSVCLSTGKYFRFQSHLLFREFEESSKTTNASPGGGKEDQCEIRNMVFCGSDPYLAARIYVSCFSMECAEIVYLSGINPSLPGVNFNMNAQADTYN